MSKFKKIPLPFTHRWIIKQNTHPGWRTELLVTLQQVWPAKDLAWFRAEANDESVTYAMKRCIEVLEPKTPPKRPEPPEHLKRYLT